MAPRRHRRALVATEWRVGGTRAAPAEAAARAASLAPDRAEARVEGAARPRQPGEARLAALPALGHRRVDHHRAAHRDALRGERPAPELAVHGELDEPGRAGDVLERDLDDSLDADRVLPLPRPAAAA